MYRIVPALDQDSLPEPHWPSQSLKQVDHSDLRRANDHGAGPSGPVAAPRRQDYCVVIGYGRAVVVDFEYEASDGNFPDVLCMVAYELDGNLQLVRTVRRWRGEFEKEPPFDIGPDTLFVAYSAWAEMTCFKVLGWKFPVRIFDQHTAYLAASNILLPQDDEEQWRKKPRKRLPTPVAPTGLPAGSKSTRTLSPKTSARAGGKSTARTPLWPIVKKTFVWRCSCCAPNCAGTSISARPTSNA